MGKPICDLLPTARPGCDFCARKPTSYGHCFGGRFAFKDRPSCCLHLGAASRREKVVNSSIPCYRISCEFLFRNYGQDLGLQNSSFADRKTDSQCVGSSLNGTHLGHSKLDVTHYKDEA